MRSSIRSMQQWRHNACGQTYAPCTRISNPAYTHAPKLWGGASAWSQKNRYLEDGCKKNLKTAAISAWTHCFLTFERCDNIRLLNDRLKPLQSRPFSGHSVFLGWLAECSHNNSPCWSSQRGAPLTAQTGSWKSLASRTCEIYVKGFRVFFILHWFTNKSERTQYVSVWEIHSYNFSYVESPESNGNALQTSSYVGILTNRYANKHQRLVGFSAKVTTGIEIRASFVIWRSDSRHN